MPSRSMHPTSLAAVMLLLSVSLVAACRTPDSAEELGIRESPQQAPPTERGHKLIYVPAYAYATPGESVRIALATTVTIQNIRSLNIMGF